MATLYKLPCIFVVENNKWAIGMSHARATGPSGITDNEPYIYKKGPAFGMPGVLLDGMDVRKVWTGTRGLLCTIYPAPSTLPRVARVLRSQGFAMAISSFLGMDSINERPVHAQWGLK